MKTTNPTPDDAPVDEELVAYLDGELDATTISRIEARLARDADYRRELARLEKAWDCLDELSSATADEAFARSTIEMLSVAAAEEVADRRAALPRQKRWRFLAGIAVLGLALLTGAAAASIAWPDPNEQLVENLPVLQNLDSYLHIDNIAFLHLLAQSGLFSDDPESVVASVIAVREVPEDREARREYIKRLVPEAKARLSARAQRFQTLPAVQQERIRQLHFEIQSDMNSKHILALLARYHRWLNTLSPGQRADIATLDLKQRVKRIAQMLREQQRRQARTPSDADREIILSFLDDYVLEHRSQLVGDLGERHRKHLQRLEAEGRRRDAATHLMLIAGAQSRRGFGFSMNWLPEEEAQKLYKKLSPEGRQVLDRLETPAQRERMLSTWIRHAVYSRFATLRNRFQHFLGSSEELERFFANELSSDERARLLALPRETMDRELRRRYIQHNRLGGFGPPPKRSGETRGRDFRNKPDRPDRPDDSPQDK